MTFAWRYEFKKGREAEGYADPAKDEYCVHRNLLQEGHRECGVEVYDLITGPIKNPIRELVEDHTKLRHLSTPGLAEEGGICKYFKSSEIQYCGFCRKEAAMEREEMKRKKFEKKAKEINYLLHNIDRIRKK